MDAHHTLTLWSIVVGYLRSFFLHFSNIIYDQNHNQQRYEAEQQRAEHKRHGWEWGGAGGAGAGAGGAGGGGAAAGSPSFHQTLCYIHLLVFPIKRSRIRSVICYHCFLSPESSSAPCPLRSSDGGDEDLPLVLVCVCVCACVCVCVPRRGDAASVSSVTSLSIPQSNFESVHLHSLPWEQQRCGPHAALKAQRHAALHRQLGPLRSTPPGVGGGRGGRGGPQCGDRCMKPSAQGGFINWGVCFIAYISKRWRSTARERHWGAMGTSLFSWVH